MSYNPLNLKDLWDITKIQNLSNPLSPFYVRPYNNHGNYVKKPKKKKYIRTEQDDKNNNLLCMILFIIYIIASVLYEFVLKTFI